MPSKIIIITGTDTGSGKTLLTCLALRHLRSRGVDALGLKPFCSGSRSDAHHIHFHNDRILPLETVNPWFFDQPLSPGAMPKRLRVEQAAVLRHIRSIGPQAQPLLVEGAGGLMSPLGSSFHLGHLIQTLQAEVVIAAPNRLGVLNQVLLNVTYLKEKMPKLTIRIALMDRKGADLSSRTNAKILRDWLPEACLVELPYLGPSAKTRAQIHSGARQLKSKLQKLFPVQP